MLYPAFKTAALMPWLSKSPELELFKLEFEPYESDKLLLPLLLLLLLLLPAAVAWVGSNAPLPSSASK